MSGSEGLAAPASARSSAPALSHGAVHGRLALMTLLWGLSWPAGRVLAQAMPPVTLSAWRFTIAAVVLLGWMRWRQGGLPRLSIRQWWGLTATAAVGVFCYSIFFMVALRQVEASRAAVVVTTNPVFTTLLAAWLFGERFNARIALGLAMAIAGAATVMTHGEPWLLLAGEVGQGEWLLIGCIATWVGYSLMGKRLMVGIDALSATALTAAIGGAMLWAAALAVDGPAAAMQAVTQASAAHLATLAFLAIGPTALSYAWFYLGIETLGAGVASSYISLVPVLGVASSVAILGEPLAASLLVGGALALAGVVLANRARLG